MNVAPSIVRAVIIVGIALSIGGALFSLPQRIAIAIWPEKTTAYVYDKGCTERKSGYRYYYTVNKNVYKASTHGKECFSLNPGEAIGIYYSKIWPGAGRPGEPQENLLAGLLGSFLIASFISLGIYGVRAKFEIR